MKPVVGAAVDPELHAQIRCLADDMGTSMSSPLRQGLAAVLACHGEAPPASLTWLLTAQDRAYLIRCGVSPADLLPAALSEVKP